jgi:DNA-binding MarR family transcriptional regulator
VALGAAPLVAAGPGVIYFQVCDVDGQFCVELNSQYPTEQIPLGPPILAAHQAMASAIETSWTARDSVAVAASDGGTRVDAANSQVAAAPSGAQSEARGVRAAAEATQAPVPAVPSLGGRFTDLPLAVPVPEPALPTLPALLAGDVGVPAALPLPDRALMPLATDGWSEGPLPERAPGLPTESPIPHEPGDNEEGSLAASGSAALPVSPGWLAGAELALVAAGAILLLAPVLSLYHRLERAELLASPRRRAALDVVRARPGATPAAVAEALGIHYNAARHHMDLLEEYGLVQRKVLGARVCYFENTRAWAPQEARRSSIAARAQHAEVLRLVEAEPGISQSEAGRRLGIPRTTLIARVATLAREGLLANERGALFSLEAPASENRHGSLR